MDWSPDRVLDFGPRTHRREFEWGRKWNLFVPVLAWRVVTPMPGLQPMNVLRRAVLRFALAGTREYVRVGDLLGVEPQLVAFIAQELVDFNLLDSSGDVTALGKQALEEAELGVADMRIGWVFQEAWSGNLLPRFVSRLEYARVEADEQGHPWVVHGSKGAPRRDPAIVIDGGAATYPPPRPLDVVDAAHRHWRQERRLRRARLDLDAVPSEVVERVSYISDQPETFHLLSFVYTPKEMEDGDEPWYVADPFGFGASPSLRDQLDQLPGIRNGRIRRILDEVTGSHAEKQRTGWRDFEDMLREEARAEVAKRWPEGSSEDSNVRERLEEAFAQLGRLNWRSEQGPKDLRPDGAYLHLRQALELSLGALRQAVPPRTSWQKLFDGDRALPRDAAASTVRACVTALGFELPESRALFNPSPMKIRAACNRGDTSNLRPLCTALILAAAADEGHPFRQLAQVDADWLAHFDEIAEVAGAEVHHQSRITSLERLRWDAERTVELCAHLMAVIGHGANRR